MTCGTCGSTRVQCVPCAQARMESLTRGLSAGDAREKVLLTRAQAAETRLAAARTAVVEGDRDALCVALGFETYNERGGVPAPAPAVARGLERIECDVCRIAGACRKHPAGPT